MFIKILCILRITFHVKIIRIFINCGVTENTIVASKIEHFLPFKSLTQIGIHYTGKKNYFCQYKITKTV